MDCGVYAWCGLQGGSASALAIHKQPPSFHAREKNNESDYHLLCNYFSYLRASLWFGSKMPNEKSPTEPWRVKLRKVSYQMSRFLVCSSALLGKPGSPGATGDLRDCITGVATLLDDSPMESDNRNGQFCEKQTCDFSMSCI